MSARPARRRHRPALLVFAVLAALVCLCLAWWQWDTYESGGGTAQNLGYALQWPAFGLAVLWAYRRFVVMESDPEEAQKHITEKGMSEIPEGILPERATTPSASSLAGAGNDDATLQEYNSYLAELNASTKQSTASPNPSASEEKSQ